MYLVESILFVDVFDLSSTIFDGEGIGSAAGFEAGFLSQLSCLESARCPGTRRNESWVARRRGTRRCAPPASAGKGAARRQTTRVRPACERPFARFLDRTVGRCAFGFEPIFLRRVWNCYLRREDRQPVLSLAERDGPETSGFFSSSLPNSDPGNGEFEPLPKFCATAADAIAKRSVAATSCRKPSFIITADRFVSGSKKRFARQCEAPVMLAKSAPALPNAGRNTVCRAGQQGGFVELSTDDGEALLN